MARCGAMLRRPSEESIRRRRCRSAVSVCGPFAFARGVALTGNCPDAERQRRSRQVVVSPGRFGFIQAPLWEILAGFRCSPVHRVQKKPWLAKLKVPTQAPAPTPAVLSSRVWSRLLLNVDGRSTPAGVASSRRRVEMVPASELRAWPAVSTMEDLGLQVG